MSPLLCVNCAYFVDNRAKNGDFPSAEENKTARGRIKGSKFSSQPNVIVVLIMPVCKCFGFSKL